MVNRFQSIQLMELISRAHNFRARIKSGAEKADALGPRFVKFTV